jgi:hypothetical protein
MHEQGKKLPSTRASTWVLKGAGWWLRMSSSPTAHTLEGTRGGTSGAGTPLYCPLKADQGSRAVEAAVPSVVTSAT